MQERAVILIVISIIILLVFVTGGFFISNYWQIVEIEPEKPSLIIERVEVENIEEEEPTVVVQQEPELEVSDAAAEMQRIIKESEELIAQAQLFIQEEENKRILIEQAREKSSQIKGIYINEFIANSQNPAALKAKQNINDLLDQTELNGVVIDIKEAYGPNLPNSLKELIKEFHQKDVWVIARICAFRDSSLIKEKPNLYLKTISNSTTSPATSTEKLWQDAGGQYWLDPKSEEVRDSLIEFAKKAIDFGFDELQFDYVRFPSDGDIDNIIYPVYDGTKEKSEVIREFFASTTDALREYKPSVILSVDLFGYVASQYQAFSIGQRLDDAGKFFDYVSPMIYPSHFYGGFSAPENQQRQLPAIYLPYQDDTTTSTVSLVSNNPYQVILRSVLAARDYFSLYGYEAKVRPWLQDFNLQVDTERGIYYDADKIKEQIQASEDAESAGWLLWNSSNIYTKEALGP